MICNIDFKKPDTLHFTSMSPEDTIDAGARVCDFFSAPRPGAVFLKGNLGAGKTCFVKGLARGMGINEHAVTSPTFVIVREYQGRLVHADLYRISSAEELFYTGFADFLDTCDMIALEWADRADLSEWFDKYLEVTIKDNSENESARDFTLLSKGLNEQLAMLAQNLI
jgi:tRNA threonylcarbamoyladenosine biosynthesis protein TsaE